MRLIFTIAFSSLFSIAAAATYNVTLGKGGQDVFDPNSLTGVVSGDVIRFQFVSSVSHSVVDSTFDQPCVSKPQGIDSGEKTSASSPNEYVLTIDSASPRWFYCDVSTHCSASGMVFAVNPTTDQSFDAFKAKATGKTATSTSPSATATKSGEAKASVHRMTAALVVGAIFLIGVML